MGTIPRLGTERDAAVVLDLSDAPPRDVTVGHLVDDPRIELAPDSAKAHDPVGQRVVDLRHVIDSTEELGERLELRPLVVRGANGDVHIDIGRDGRAHLGSPL